MTPKQIPHWVPKIGFTVSVVCAAAVAAALARSRIPPSPPAPRFVPSQRAWVLTGSAATVNPAVPASEGRDGDDR